MPIALKWGATKLKGLLRREKAWSSQFQQWAGVEILVLAVDFIHCINFSSKQCHGTKAEELRFSPHYQGSICQKSSRLRDVFLHIHLQQG